MDHLAQRRDVVLGAHIGRELHEPVQLRGHHGRVGDPVARNEPQRLLGVPLLHEHHRVLEVGREVAEGERRHVVHRRGHQVHRVAARLNVVAQQVAAEDLHPGLGIERGERALHRLGPPGRARGVLHELPGDPVRRRSVGLAGQHGVERGEAFERARRTDGDASGLGHPGLPGSRAGHGAEPLVRHQRLGAGVAAECTRPRPR